MSNLGADASTCRHTKSATPQGTQVPLPKRLRYWRYGGGRLGPVLPGHRKRQPLSYLDLIEVAFVATFRVLGVPLQRIRRARAYAAQVLNSEYPFAEHKWLTEGHHVMLDLRHIDDDDSIDSLVVGDSRGQITWEEMVGERFAQFDYEQDLALIWHIRGRSSRVTIDPRVSFGAPQVRGSPYMGAERALACRREHFRYRRRPWA